MFEKRQKKCSRNQDAVWLELRMLRLELHQILLCLSGQKTEIRFLSEQERTTEAKALRDQYFGVAESCLPESVRDQLFILESPACCAYALSGDSSGRGNNGSE